MLEFFRNRRWVLWALLSFLSFSRDNFLLDVIAHEADEPIAANISAIIVSWAVVGAFGVFMFAIQALLSGCLNGIGGGCNIVVALLAGVLNCVGQFCLTSALAMDPDSAGPITATLPLNSVIVGTCAWVWLGEDLGRSHVLGIFIALAGPVCMSAADTSHAALKGIAWGSGAAGIFGLSNFQRKWVAFRAVGSNLSVATLGCFAAGACFLVSCLLCAIAGRGLAGLAGVKPWLLAAGSGAFYVSGTFSFQFALQGLAGPASALANMNSLGVLTLTQVFYHPHLKPLKLLGMGLCISGIIVLTLAPTAGLKFQALPDESELSTHAQAETITACHVVGRRELIENSVANPGTAYAAS